MRIQLTRASDGSKVIVMVLSIVAVMKLAASQEEGAPAFSAGSWLLLDGGHQLKVREFVSVVDYLISKVTESGPAAKYFAKEDPTADADYAEFQTQSGRNAPAVQTAAEVQAQAADQPELATAGAPTVF